MAIFTTLRGEIHNSIQHKLRNSMEVDNVGIIAISNENYHRGQRGVRVAKRSYERSILIPWQDFRH